MLLLGNYTTLTDKGHWDKWLEIAEKCLYVLGYRRYNQKYKLSDFQYWKVFNDDQDNPIYQVGLLFYDYRVKDLPIYRIGVQFECMILDTDDRIDLSVNKDLTLDQFEDMAKKFYQTYKK